MDENGKQPRRHDPAWADNTNAERHARRRARLDEIANTHGWGTWAKYETAILNDETEIGDKIMETSEVFENNGFVEAEDRHDLRKRYPWVEQKYDFIQKVEGGYMFWKYAEDFETWKRQK